ERLAYRDALGALGLQVTSSGLGIPATSSSSPRRPIKPNSTSSLRQRPGRPTPTVLTDVAAAITAAEGLFPCLPLESDTDDWVELDPIRRGPVLAMRKVEEAQAHQGRRFRHPDKCWSDAFLASRRVCRRTRTELAVERLPGGSYLRSEKTARSQR